MIILAKFGVGDRNYWNHSDSSCGILESAFRAVRVTVCVGPGSRFLS